MKLNSLYVAVKDFGRAKAFYESIIFRREPSLTTDRFVFFDLDGFLFGLFDPSVTGEEVRFGNNCVPTLEVTELETFYQHLQDSGVEIVMPLQEVNETVIFQCSDFEGNVLEFYRWQGSPAF